VSREEPLPSLSHRGQPPYVEAGCGERRGGPQGRFGEVGVNAEPAGTGGLGGSMLRPAVVNVEAVRRVGSVRLG
jgi:hypothetical protein